MSLAQQSIQREPKNVKHDWLMSWFGPDLNKTTSRDPRYNKIDTSRKTWTNAYGSLSCFLLFCSCYVVCVCVCVCVCESLLCQSQENQHSSIVLACFTTGLSVTSLSDTERRHSERPASTRMRTTVNLTRHSLTSS